VDTVNDTELREMVRASIARLGAAREPERPSPAGHASHVNHASFVRLPILASGDADGQCIIEPSVRCNHCGYCLSYGH